MAHRLLCYSTLGSRVIKKKKKSTMPGTVHRYRTEASSLIPHKVFIQSCIKRQFPREFVTLSFTITNFKNQSTDLCGN